MSTAREAGGEFRERTADAGPGRGHLHLALADHLLVAQRVLVLQLARYDVAEDLPQAPQVRPARGEVAEYIMAREDRSRKAVAASGEWQE